MQNSGTFDRLYSVYFIDLNFGTAVGHFGTILRTTDGGTTWTKQNSGTTINLWGVCFIDSNTGFVVGSVFYTNHGGTRVGQHIILKTTDGGINWVQKSGITNGEI